MIKKIVLVNLSLLMALNAISLDDYKENKEDTFVNLKVDSLVKDVLKNNGDALKQYIQIVISKKQVDYEKGIYDPVFTSNFLRQSTNVPNSVENELVRFQETYQDRVDYFNVGISGLLPTGAQWSFLYTNNKKNSSLIEQNKDYDTEYDSSVKIELEQPLLKNAGIKVTEAKISLSKFEKDINRNLYKQKLMELQGLSIQVYWRLYGAQKIYESWEKSIVLSEKQLKDLELRALNGKVAKTEVLEAKSAMSIRKSEYENAKNRFNEAQNQLLTLLNISYSELENIQFKLNDNPNSNLSTLLTLKEYKDLAFAHWPEYINAKKNIKKEFLQKEYSENQTLPKLNVTGSVERTSLQTNRSDSYDQAFDPEFTSWTFGMNLSMPILNKQANSSLEISKLKLRQAKVDLKTLENNLVNSIATKIDNVKSSKKQYELYKEGLEIKEYLLQIENDKFEAGRINAKLILEKEEDYMNYKRKYLSSIVNWKTSEALLEIAAGNLLNKYKIDFTKLYSNRVESN